MFDFLKSASCAPEIGLGTGLNITGQAIINVGNMVAGAGCNLQASGWARRLSYKGIIVGLRIEDGVDESVNAVTALMMHFSNPLNLVKFRATNPAAAELAAKYQAEFDARSKAAYEAEGLTFPIAQPAPQPAPAQQQPQPQPAPQPQQQQQSLNQMISELSDDELELAGGC